MVKERGLSSQVPVCTGSKRSQGDRVEKRSWKDQTYRMEILVVAGGDRIVKSENTEIARLMS